MLCRGAKFVDHSQAHLIVLTVFFALGLCVASSKAQTIEAWGFNQSGQLGDGTTTQRFLPTTALFSVQGPLTIAAGAHSTFALTQGNLYSWGWNGVGDLGDASTPTQRETPSMSGIVASNITAISTGSDHTLAIQSGNLLSWGYNFYGQLGNGTNNNGYTPAAMPGFTAVTAIAAGFNHSLAVQNGNVYSWGENEEGELGVGYDSFESKTPIAVVGLPTGITDVRAGIYDSFAIKNGAVYAWGWNGYGQLGIGTNSNQYLPEIVSGFSTGVTALAAGYSHTLAIKDGHVYGWGQNQFGQLGDTTLNNSSVPQEIDPSQLTDIVSVAASFGSSYALSSDGSLWGWGRNLDGELGLGDASNRLIPTLLPAPAGLVFSSISVNANGVFAVATLSPVPEPKSLLIVGLAAIGLMLFRVRPAIASQIIPLSQN